MTQQASQGKFTQSPHILYDKCSLPEEASYTYEKLCRHLYKDGNYTGSYSKLGEMLRLTKNKTYRIIKALEKANMLQTNGSGERLTISLNTTELWMLNTLYGVGLNIPYWTDLTTTLESVLKIERNEEGKATLSSDTVLKLERIGLKIEQIVLILEHFVLKLERIGLKIERDKEGLERLVKLDEAPTEKALNTIIRNTSNTVDSSATNVASNTPPRKKRVQPPDQPTEPQVVLTPAEQAVWDAWNQMKWFKGVQQKLTPTAAAHCKTLAPYQPTEESMYKCRNWATSPQIDKKGYYKGRGWNLGDLVNEYPRMLSAQEKPGTVNETLKNPALVPAASLLKNGPSKEQMIAMSERKMADMRAKNEAEKRKRQAN